LFGAGNALAAERLSDPLMDLISAGDVPSCSPGPGCNTSFSSTMTNTVLDANGVLHTTTTGAASCSADTCRIVGVIGVINTNSGSTSVLTNSIVGTPPPFPPFPR
jgi:hypothetical protein